MAVDAASYGRGDDRRQAMFQSALVATLRTAAAAAGLGWDRWIWERAGDGGLALLPGDQPGPLLADDFVWALDRTLGWLNSELAWDSRLRLRVAIHFGTAIPAENGWAGQGVVAVSRLLDSHPVRLALAAAEEANLAVILSRQAFDEVVRPGGVSLREADFRRVTVTVKEYSAQAWLRVPGLRPGELAVGHARDDKLAEGHARDDILAVGHARDDILAVGHARDDILAVGHARDDTLERAAATARDAAGG